MASRRAATGALAIAAIAAVIAAHGCNIIAGIEAPDNTPAKQQCINGVRDADETDIDCGGPTCLKCGGDACQSDEECQTGACLLGNCRLPTCTDTVWDGYESSVDCGDPRGECPLCADGLHCWNGCNCQSKFCNPETHLCEEPANGANCDACKDGVKDSGETDVDCGGRCSKCGDGRSCSIDDNCQSGHCVASKCRPASCFEASDGGEGGTTCGGPCPKCEGDACVIAAECASMNCVNSFCAAP